LFNFFNVELDPAHILNDYQDELLEYAESVLINDKSLKEEIKEFFSQPDIINQINLYIDKQSELFEEYIASIVKNKRALTLDLGFHGTIPQAIDNAVSQNDLFHILAVGSNKMFQKIFSGIKIDGFLTYKDNGWSAANTISRTPEVIEQLVMSIEHGTTIGYAPGERGVLPTTKSCFFNDDEKNLRKYTQQGVMAFQKEWFALKKFKGLPFLHKYIDAETLGSILSRFIQCPTPNEVFYLGQIKHDDNFGSNSSGYLLDPKIGEVLKEIGSKSFLAPQIAVRPYGVVYWPQLYVSAQNPSYFLEKYLELRPDMYEEQCLLSLKNRLAENSVNSVVIYGASVTGEKIANFLKDAEGLHIIAFCDRNEKLWGTTLAGIPIYSFEYIQSLEFDAYIIGSMGRGKEISRYIEEFGDKKTTPQIILPF
jgi:hypothetical protein